MGVRVLSLFDGISVGYSALIREGFAIEKYYASEIDRFAIAVSAANHPDILQVGCIKALDTRALAKLGRIDILLAAPPCQGFSPAGKRLGFGHTQTQLYYEFVRVLHEAKPTWFLIENVANPQLIEALASDLGGIAPIVINSALVSGQNRVRVYFTNIAHVCQPSDRSIRLSDVIGPYDYIWRYPRGNNNRTKLDDITKCPTLTTSNWKHNFKVVRSGTLLPFTAEQAETLQTLPVGYTASVSDKQRFRLLGNAWTLDAITHILSALRTVGEKNNTGRQEDDADTCEEQTTAETQDELCCRGEERGLPKKRCF